ncbi:uroporphyrinogen decarboxylase chloroplastic [Phtheirospermum japonicum]|uniref:Uroporphyrinogen decarboxylase chloroplastic n=1 Tax=Phtheirospermum japonicum TaxID=374723 RepID=A0A830BX79_9LAMI|nr:uroporphyrinogen decarboxylase chloroplastic [Phtheirospermum japonicum]
MACIYSSSVSSISAKLIFAPLSNHKPRFVCFLGGAVAEPKAVNATEPLLLNDARRQRRRETPGVAYETSRESYQTLCEKHPSFRERSENVDLVVEISLQPWKVFKPDVILFSDILTPLSGMNIPFDIVKGKGPIIFDPIRTTGDVEKVREFTPDESVPYVGEALTILRKERECVEDCSGSAQEELREKASDHDGGLKAVKIESVDVLVAAEKCTSSENDSGSCLGEGVDYYNDLIDTILANGMTPFVTLFHWDTPFCLEKEYDGFLSKKIVDDFRAYAEFCFWEFGDRVKYWVTLNEPWSYAVHGYVRGDFPPSKAPSSPTHRLLNTILPHRSVQLPDRPVPLNRTYSDVKYDKSDPAKDAYTVARNLLLAHSAAVHSYRTKFKGVPYDKDSVDDKAAALRSLSEDKESNSSSHDAERKNVLEQRGEVEVWMREVYAIRMSIFTETPFKRSLESPSAWKSPWFLRGYCLITI